MSAICGIFARRSSLIRPDMLDRMLGALAHRGPDGAGQWRAQPVALGQQLAYTTPQSQHETLPWHDAEANLTVVADARLDNRETLCEALDIPPIERAQLPDSRLLGRAYRKWGPACVDYLLGDFAFALWDARARTLFCACDPMGIRPLYYYLDDARLVFATEIKGLLAHPAVPKRLNQRKLAYLAVPVAAILDKETTYFDTIYRLPAATTLVVTAEEARKHTYWQPDPQARLPMKEDEAFDTFRELLFEAVAARLRTDKPVTALLSGGLDSSAVVAVAAQVLKKHNRALTTLSAVLPLDSEAKVADEKPFIEQFRN